MARRVKIKTNNARELNVINSQPPARLDGRNTMTDSQQVVTVNKSESEMGRGGINQI